MKVSPKSAIRLAVLATAGAVALFVAPAAASAAVPAAAPALVRPMSNSCSLPTTAGAHSHFVRSFSSCVACEAEAVYLTDIIYNYYCTYNPSNNLNDLHWKYTWD